MGTAIIIESAEMGYRKGQVKSSVLRDVNCAFHPGELVGVAGMNGAGKSTLLRTLAGLIPLQSGKIMLDGSELRKLSINDVAKKVAVVLTEKVSGFNLSVYDAVSAGQMPYTNSFHQLEPRHIKLIESAMQSTGVTEHRNKPLGELSDGLYQKTMIARALAQQAPVMLLDEPNAYLDYGSRHALFLLLSKLCEQERKCILLSTHDLDLMIKYCHKVLLVADGKAELLGLAEAKNHPAFIAIGGGYL